MTPRRRLTDEYVKALPIPAPKDGGKPTTVLHYDNGARAVAGLALRVTSGGARSWVLVARFPSGKRDGKPHNPTARKIGSWPDMRLPEAREIAHDWNRLIGKGVDPQEKAAEEARAKQAEREERQREEARRRAGTFANVAETYIARVTPKMRTGRDAAAIIKRDLVSRWGNRPVAEISRADVINMVEDVLDRGQYAAAAAYKQGRALYAWALEREDPHRPTLGIVANPFANLRVEKLIGKLKARQHTLNEREIALLWQATEDNTLTGYPINPYVRLLLILGVRRRELAQATWDEFDLTDPSKATWLLAHTRTKNEEPRAIPLPRLAVDILKTLPRFAGGPYLFSTTGGRTPITNFSRLKEAIDRKLDAISNGTPIRAFRLHDLRRSARSNWSALSISPLVCELMLGHVQRGIVPVYDTHRYLDEQREGYEKWCARLRALTEPAPDNLVQLPVRA